MVEKFNSLFVNTSANLATKIPYDKTNFESNLLLESYLFLENNLTEEEFKIAFFAKEK